MHLTAACVAANLSEVFKTYLQLYDSSLLTSYGAGEEDWEISMMPKMWWVPRGREKPVRAAGSQQKLPHHPQHVFFFSQTTLQLLFISRSSRINCLFMFYSITLEKEIVMEWKTEVNNSTKKKTRAGLKVLRLLYLCVCVSGRVRVCTCTSFYSCVNQPLTDYVYREGIFICEDIFFLVLTRPVGVRSVLTPNPFSLCVFLSFAKFVIVVVKLPRDVQASNDLTVRCHQVAWWNKW